MGHGQFALAVLLAACTPPPKPDTILVGGKIFTADSTRPWVEAIAVTGERITAVGSSDDIRRLAGAETRIVELAGRVVVPGFNDAHDHVNGDPPPTFVADPSPLPDPASRTVLDSVKAAAARLPPGSVITTVIGPGILDDPVLRRSALDRVAPTHAVFLMVWSGHGIIANTAGLRALGVAETSPDPLGGYMERDAKGSLTGLLHEYAGWSPMIRSGASGGAGALAAGLRARADSGIALGITSIQSYSNGGPPAMWRRVLAEPGPSVRFRLVVMPGTTPSGRDESGWDSLRTDPAAGSRVTGLKYIVDGTPVERFAFMREPYTDIPGRGRLNFPVDTLRAILRECVSRGIQPQLHIVGDSAVATVLALMSEVAPDSVWQRLRPRIEHGEGVTADLVPQARRLGLIVVQNPSHFALDAMATARWGAARRARMQLFKSLLAAGVPIAIGSDGPQQPGLNLLFAVIHPDNPAEALTMEQAVTAYTRGSAYAEFAEREKGTLAPGMLADLAVLSQDIFTVPPPALPATRSELTMVGGRVVYEK